MAAVQLNTLIEQVEKIGVVRSVFERNVAAQLVNTFRIIEVTPDILHLGELLRLSAKEVVETWGSSAAHAAAVSDFIAMTKELKAKIVELNLDREVSKRREIDRLGL
jgi:hypothetical protein